jgi:hypothetical protein
VRNLARRRCPVWILLFGGARIGRIALAVGVSIQRAFNHLDDALTAPRLCAMLAMFEDRTSPWNAYPDYRGSFSILGDGGINVMHPSPSSP